MGNPPWDVIEPLSQEFWSNYDPLFRELNKQEAIARASELRTDPGTDLAWRTYDRRFGLLSNWCKQSGIYSHTGKGKNDTFKLFAERFHQLNRVSLRLMRYGPQKDPRTAYGFLVLVHDGPMQGCRRFKA